MRDIIDDSIKLLEHEHDIILKFCDKLEFEALKILNGEEINFCFLRNSIEFIRNFADGTHHRKEEDVLFQIMIDNLGEIADKVIRNGMLIEHQLARGYVMRLEENLNLYEKDKKDKYKLQVLTNMMSYVNLLREHAEKENTTVYPFAKRSLTEELKNEVDLKTREFVKMEDKERIDEILNNLGLN